MIFLRQKKPALFFSHSLKTRDVPSGLPNAVSNPHHYREDNRLFRALLIKWPVAVRPVPKKPRPKKILLPFVTTSRTTSTINLAEFSHSSGSVGSSSVTTWKDENEVVKDHQPDRR